VNQYTNDACVCLCGLVVYVYRTSMTLSRGVTLIGRMSVLFVDSVSGRRRSDRGGRVL